MCRNRPYARATSPVATAAPEEAIAAKIEINRALYMDERLIERSTGAPHLIRRITRLIKALSEIDSNILKPDHTLPKAAE